MKKRIRQILNVIADYLEVVISILVIATIIIALVKLLNNVGFFFSYNGNSDLFNETLGSIMNIVIGIEFLRMLSKHNLSSVVEVLLFAIARKLIIDYQSTTEYLVGIIAITILLAARKYLIIQGQDN